MAKIARHLIDSPNFAASWMCSSVTSNFSYDPLYELTQVLQGATTTETYSYDGVGNRLSSLGVSLYSYNTSNELTSKPGVTYTYDNNGNTLTKVDASGTTTYNWNFENRLTSVVLPGVGTVSFKYDPFGRRIQKSSSAGTTNFVYDGANVLEEVDTTGNVVARYVQGPGIDEPLAETRSGTTSYYQADGLGSVTSLSNSSGALANTYTYDSFGKLTASSGTVVNPFRYTGRDSDGEIGLYYYRARYYDQSVGRFISEDPIGFGGGINFYAYAGGDPTNFTDLFGLAPGDWWDPRSYDFSHYDAWDTVRDVGNVAEGFTDALTFGSASRLNNALGAGQYVDRCGIGHKLGTAAGIVSTTVLGGAIGAEAAEANAGKKGFEFSHWIPDRMSGPRIFENGNSVSIAEHAVNDPFRYRFMPAAWKASNPMNPAWLQQLNRIPFLLRGAAAGVAYGGAGAMAGRRCGCH